MNTDMVYIQPMLLFIVGLICLICMQVERRK
jgi:hypothetical protein